MEVACKHPKPLFKTQNSEFFVEYDKRFDMKIGKLNIDAAHPYQNREDEKSYIPVTFYKIQEPLTEKSTLKIKIVHDYKIFH